MPARKKAKELPSLFGDIPTEPKSVNTTIVKSVKSLPVLNSFETLEDIRASLGECTRCKLHEIRTATEGKIVFGEGNPKAEIMFVGEAPGKTESETGRPFVGRAGELLDKMIQAMGLSRSEVYIANVIRCRPPENRNPDPDEVAACSPFLIRQIAAVSPRALITLGNPAFRCLIGEKTGITTARGNWYEYNGIRLMPTLHPAYLLRSPDKKNLVWKDLKKVLEYIKTGR